MEFVPLHIYSGFSYLQSGLTINKIVSLAKKLGYTQIGLSDNSTLSGYAPFFHECEKNGIKPIFGMDYPLEEGSFSLYVLNEEGYKNLLELSFFSSKGNKSLDLLKTYSEDLYVIYEINGESFLKDYQEDKSLLVNKFQKLNKKITNFALGLPYSLSYKELESIREFVQEFPYTLIAFPKISYPKKEDAIVLDIVSAILNKKNLDYDQKNGDEYFLNKEEIKSYYQKEEIENITKFTSLINFSLIQKRGGLLHFENKEGLSSDDFLKKLVFSSLKNKGLDTNKEYVERANYELDIINKMGYADYFLIVSDYVHFAKKNDVLVGPGRGSGAGSLVSFCLDIVGADPIRYGLLFERFLNPERQSLPDIDVDFEDINREKVINYIKGKYGLDHTGHVLTTQTILAKEAIRDIGRVYNYKQNEIELLISTIIDDKKSLRDNYRLSKQFRDLVDSDPYFLRFVSLASKIEGLPRQAGLHAAGIIINDSPLEKALPVSYSNEVGYVCCLEKDYLEEQGFLKMDILGLTNLSTIKRTLALIKRYKGIEVDPYYLPYEDPKGIELIKRGETMGLFQLESPGMKRAIKEVEPSSFSEVAALLALFRPGPMQSIPTFAKRKKGLIPVTYLCKELEPILKETYGIIVYQEQIMQIVRAVAGFSYAEADLFRRAISKKKMDKLLALKEKFFLGTKKMGHSEKLANDLYNLIERFANYGFNKSHAVSYAVLTCQMAYLKAHYPEEFYCALLATLSPSEAKFKNTLSETKKRGLSLALPDINKSEESFIIDEGKIRLPLSSIKGIGNALAYSIIDERRSFGPYIDLFDMVARLKKYHFTLPLLIRLIDAGALDNLYPSRASLRASAYSAFSYAEMLYGEDGKALLLDIGLEKPVMKIMPDNYLDNLESEHEALGMMVSGSPLAMFKEKIENKKALPLSEIENYNGEMLTYGILKSIRAITTKKGNKMAFLEAYDEYSDVSFTMFQDAYNDYFPLLKEERPILIYCHKDNYRGDGYIITKIELLEKNQ